MLKLKCSKDALGAFFLGYHKIEGMNPKNKYFIRKLLLGEGTARTFRAVRGGKCLLEEDLQLDRWSYRRNMEWRQCGRLLH